MVAIPSLKADIIIAISRRVSHRFFACIPLHCRRLAVCQPRSRITIQHRTLYRCPPILLLRWIVQRMI